MLTERQLLILKAIIRDYTNKGQPIGSKRLEQQLPIHASSATIRNEMAALEKLGLIAKEHSSSGRIPSERGYRYYVDHIMKPAKIDRGAVQNIRQSFGNEFQKVDEIVATSARILSDLTQYTAISLKPESADIRLEGFRMVPIGDRQVMVILVTSDGTVESQMYNLPAGIHGDELESVIRVINDKVVGLSLNQVVAKLHECLPLITKYLHKPDGFMDAFGSILDKAVKKQVYVSGKTNLLSFAHWEDPEQIKALYSLIDQSANLGMLLENRDGDVSVKLGSELSDALLSHYSLVSAAYDDGNNGQGIIAILGPTNMPYSKVIGLLDAFRDELTQRIFDYYQHLN